MTKDEVEDLLRRAGCSQVKTRGKWTVGTCPFHSEKTPSFKVKIGKESPGYYCFGCGKGGKLRWILVDLGLAKRPEGGDETWRDRVKRSEWRPGGPQRPDRPTTPPKPSTWPQEALRPFIGEIPRYALERGLTKAQCEKWNLGWDRYFKRLLFPIFDRNRRLRGITGRSLDPSHPVKYAHYIYDLKRKKPFPFIGDREEGTYLETKKSEVLFGENQLGELASRDTAILVVEGHIDVVRLDQHGWASLGVMGSRPSRTQEDRLVDLLPKGWRVVLIPDGDEAGRKSVEHYENLARRVDAWVVYLPEGRDPAQIKRQFVGDVVRTARPL